MTLVQRPDGRWQEVRPACCMNGDLWDRPGSFTLIGGLPGGWRCAACGDEQFMPGPAAPPSGYPRPFRFDPTAH